jgi:hypothetical protein
MQGNHVRQLAADPRPYGWTRMDSQAIYMNLASETVPTEPALSLRTTLQKSEARTCCLQSSCDFLPLAPTNSEHLPTASLRVVLPSFKLYTMPLSCDLDHCTVNKPFDSKEALRKHRYEHHTTPDAVSVLGNATFVIRQDGGLLECPFPTCYKKHATRSGHQKHVVTHEGVFIVTSKRPRGSSVNILEEPGPPSNKRGRTEGPGFNGTPVESGAFGTPQLVSNHILVDLTEPSSPTPSSIKVYDIGERPSLFCTPLLNPDLSYLLTPTSFRSLPS